MGDQEVVEPDAPGWYPHPESDELYLYWNGERWTRRAPSALIESALTDPSASGPAPRTTLASPGVRRTKRGLAGIDRRSVLIGAGLALGLFTLLVGSSLLGSDPTVDFAEPGPTSAPSTTQAPRVTIPEPEIPPEKLPVVRLVGVELVPGLVVVEGKEGCRWARRSKTVDGASTVLAEETFVHEAQALVEVRPDDASLTTIGCTSVTRYVPPAVPGTRFGDGTFAVNQQVRPGTYQAAGGPTCAWRRLAGFTGEPMTVLASGSGDDGQAEIVIVPTDAGVSSSGCGDWTLMS